MTEQDPKDQENKDMIDKNGKVIKPDFVKLTEYAKLFSNLTDEKEALLRDSAKDIAPHLVEVTEHFYEVLESIPETLPYLEGRIDALKLTHLRWMQSLFSGPFNANYTESMYNVGEIHVKVDLPVEFMSGGITLISNELYRIAQNMYHDTPKRAADIVSAINSVMGFSLLVMQKSYNASVEEQLDKFLLITGMSRPLFDKLSSTFKTTH